MKVLFLLLSVLGSGVAIAGEATSRSEAPPTLDRAVLVFSSVDRAEVYLGESVELRLEYWELSMRGLKAQPLYRGGGITLPALEGFYAGLLQTETDDAVRDGSLYTVTRYRQRLYPAVAGELEIGAWRWQGSVRGYIASRPQSKSVDLSTPAIPVHVRPLPPPPSTFRGAVGEFEISLVTSTAEMTMGEPASLTLEVQGSGNPATLEAPSLPEADWYRLGDPSEAGETVTDPQTGTFVKKFHYEFMPLKAGAFKVPSVSLTYFSPSIRQFKSALSEAIAVHVATLGPAESLVVIRGGPNQGGASGPMEDGKLALAPLPPAFALWREYPGFGNVLIVAPPLLWLALFLSGGGWRSLKLWRGSVREEERLAHQIAALAHHPQPVEGLRGLVRGALVPHQGPASSGLDDRELVASLGGRIGPEAVACIARVLQRCEDHCYGKGVLGMSEIRELTRDLPEALAAVERYSRIGGTEQ